MTVLGLQICLKCVESIEECICVCVCEEVELKEIPLKGKHQCQMVFLR